MKSWEIIADKLSKASWSRDRVSAIDSNGRTIWIADAHRDNGKRLVVRAEEKLTAFVELESVIRASFDKLRSFRRARPAVSSSGWLGIWCDCLLARSLRRIMVGNQPPAPLLLYPHSGKASVTGNSLAFVLPIHY
jgi:hypothetical protein